LPPFSGPTLQKEVVDASTMWVLIYQMTGYHTPALFGVYEEAYAVKIQGNASSKIL